MCLAAAKHLFQRASHCSLAFQLSPSVWTIFLCISAWLLLLEVRILIAVTIFSPRISPCHWQNDKKSEKRSFRAVRSLCVVKGEREFARNVVKDAMSSLEIAQDSSMHNSALSLREGRAIVNTASMGRQCSRIWASAGVYLDKKQINKKHRFEQTNHKSIQHYVSMSQLPWLTLGEMRDRSTNGRCHGIVCK
jgi:hypothetical protein